MQGAIAVFVGYLQLAEYGETVSVHDRVSWQVCDIDAERRGEVFGACCELDRYSWLDGATTKALAGQVTSIYEAVRDGSTVPCFTTGRPRADRTLGFVVRIEPESSSAEGWANAGAS